MSFNLQAVGGAGGGNTNISLQDMKFHELPAGHKVKSEIEYLSNEFLKPMKEGLNEISKFDSNVLEILDRELRKIQLSVLKLKNHQEQLSVVVERLREESREHASHARRYGKTRLQQVKQSSGGIGAVAGMMIQHGHYNESIPNEFYKELLIKLEKRLDNCNEEIQQFAQQLSKSIDAFTICNGNGGTAFDEVSGLGYNQRQRIGPQQLVHLLQQQHETFSHIASIVAQTHQDTDHLRDYYLKTFSISKQMNPFHAADRDEEAKKKKMQQNLRKAREESNLETKKQLKNQIDHQLVQQLQSQQQQPSMSFNLGGGGVGGGLGGAFGGLGGGFNLGGTAAPAPSFGAAPAQPFGSFNLGGGGINLGGGALNMAGDLAGQEKKSVKNKKK